MEAKRFFKPKAYPLFAELIAVLFAVVPLIFINGCKYNVTEPLWDQPYTAPAAPKITQVNPTEAAGGINTITITGENLVVGTGVTWVYFDNTQADVVSSSPTSIVVHRPNLVSDSASIKIIPHDAIQEAVYKPYKVTQVVSQYGNFLQNLALSVIVVDKDENLYTLESTSKNLHKVTPDGTNTVIGKSTYTPFDGKIGPDGNLYLTEKNRAVDKIDLTTGNNSRWTILPSGVIPKYCDFSDNNYFYCGGTGTDLVILPFDLSASAVKSGFYANDDIQAIRFFSGYIYVASIPIGPAVPAKIWRDKVNSNGSVGDRELVFDMNTVGDSSAVSGIAISSDGKLYVTTYSAASSMIVIDPSSKYADSFYKNIIPPYCFGIYWGSGNYLYAITGNTIAAQTWTVYRVDMGKKSAPYY